MDEQRAVVRRILSTAMAILRDDQPFDPKNMVFGRLYDEESDADSNGKIYRYQNLVKPSLEVKFWTNPDPLDYSADRFKVPVVPIGVIIDPDPLLEGLAQADLKALLQLDDYWIAADGVRVQGNEILTRYPQNPNLQRFRYRSKDIPGSKFAVDVILDYFNPLNDPSPPKLMFVSIERVYPRLTPAEREQRRLQQEQDKRKKFGDMGLRTGMICPETGFWEGWSSKGPTDQTVVYAGSRFPQVKTIPMHLQSWSPTEDGQWMWLRPYDPTKIFGG